MLYYFINPSLDIFSTANHFAGPLRRDYLSRNVRSDVTVVATEWHLNLKIATWNDACVSGRIAVASAWEAVGERTAPSSVLGREVSALCSVL